MIHLINYADQNFKWPQRLAAHLAKYFSGVNLISSFGPEDIDLEFKTHNDAVLKMSRGGGYWLWKPYSSFIPPQSLHWRLPSGVSRLLWLLHQVSL